MNVGLYHTVAAMRTNQQRVEIISSNIANSESAGFKRMLHVAHGSSGWGREPSHELRTLLQMAFPILTHFIGLLV